MALMHAITHFASASIDLNVLLRLAVLFIVQLYRELIPLDKPPLLEVSGRYCFGTPEVVAQPQRVRDSGVHLERLAASPARSGLARHQQPACLKVGNGNNCA
jgi:hypothetical protein